MESIHDAVLMLMKLPNLRCFRFTLLLRDFMFHVLDDMIPKWGNLTDEETACIFRPAYLQALRAFASLRGLEHAELWVQH